MDVKEKQAFDEYFQEKYPELYKDVFNEDGDERAIIGYSFALSAWQARAKAQAVPEWISVNDKLPPANILVLGMSQTPRNIFNIYNVMALDEFEEADVTHWMPLPDAPQEST